ncbi:MAG TPA: hypothetical protein VIX81_03405, partial [Gammaproteobacteria bacterium]
MLEIKTGRWYRLIGGELLRVDAVDQAAGIVDGAYQSGSGTRLALSAFTGAVEVPPPAQAPVRNRVLDFSLDQPLDQPADADAEEPLDGPLDSVIEAAPKSGAPRKARLDLDATLEELDRAFTAEAAAEEAAAAAEHAPAPVAAQAPARPAPGETAALPFAEPDQAASATPGDG